MTFLEFSDGNDDELWDAVTTLFMGLGLRPWEGVIGLQDEIVLLTGLAEATVRTRLEDLWRARLGEEVSWPAVVDGDRLASAFAALENRGIAARMAWGCCEYCGPEDVVEREFLDQTFWGNCSIHFQDAIDLHQGFVDIHAGASDWVPDAEALPLIDAVHDALLQELAAAGLSWKWDGNFFHCVRVTGLDWKKRLPR